jgi:hypothetical protein
VSRHEAGEAVPVVSFIPSSLGYIYRIQLIEKFGLLIDRTSSIYLKVSFVFNRFLYKHCLIGVEENVDKESGTTGSRGDADDLLINVPSELDKHTVMKIVFDMFKRRNDYVLRGLHIFC